MRLDRLPRPVLLAPFAAVLWCARTALLVAVAATVALARIVVELAPWAVGALLLASAGALHTVAVEFSRGQAAVAFALVLAALLCWLAAWAFRRARSAAVALGVAASLLGPTALGLWSPILAGWTGTLLLLVAPVSLVPVALAWCVVDLLARKRA